MHDNEGSGAAQSSARRENADREATANYIADLSAELAALARQHGLDALSYILDMARLEAESTIRHVSGRR
jgi:hypothetical protein